MKRLGIILLVAILFLTGCSIAEPKPPEVQVLSSVDAEVICQEITFKGSVLSSGDGTMTMKLSEPEDLKGLTCTIYQQQIALEYYGIRKEMDVSALPEYSALIVLKELIENSSVSEQLVLSQMGETQSIFTGESEYGAYTIKVDNETGNILSFDLAETGLKVNFSNHMSNLQQGNLGE